ncbi:hypothetical protein KP509_14G008200 [Ceratopteris richardii]|uniref:Zinc finger PHD-type domain-containing protein n=1 Tax=Ceratopteris richardii TaxID=49495 RepID=A0A8T2T9A9_CERRI|nr:hypothetical protein KP509_14G008200 [Ceratopteris richardii]
MEQLQLGADQSMINGSKEDNFSYGQTLTCSPRRHKMSFMSIQISRSDLSDDGGSVTFVEHANIQKKGSLEVKKFIYPRFKRRAYYDVTTGTLQCFSKKEKKMEARLRAKFASCTSSNILSEDEALQKKGDGDKSHHHPREISLRDIVVCESPSNALEFRSKNELLPRICTATPNPVTRNPAFRIMDSPCAETFPDLNFASLGDQSDEQLALLKCSVRSVTSFTGEKIFPHRTNEATDKINILNLATNSNDLRKITLEADAQLDELEKENNPPPLSSNNKAILAYRSMQKAKKRRKSKPGFLSSSSRNSNDNDADFLRTRNYGRLSLVLGNKQTSLGPILRSFRNTQAITRSLKQVQMSVRRSKKSFVKALLEKYIWNQRIKFGSPNHREACLPFLSGKVGRRVECFYCREFITSYDSTICSYKDCCRSYHLTCARGLADFNFRKNGDAVCPQHACMVCRGYNKSKVFRCDRCIVSAHMNCFAFPEFCTFVDSKPNHFICWRHPENWRHDSEAYIDR